MPQELVLQYKDFWKTCVWETYEYCWGAELPLLDAELFPVLSPPFCLSCLNWGGEDLWPPPSTCGSLPVSSHKIHLEQTPTKRRVAVPLTTCVLGPRCTAGLFQPSPGERTHPFRRRETRTSSAIPTCCCLRGLGRAVPGSAADALLGLAASCLCPRAFWCPGCIWGGEQTWVSSGSDESVIGRMTWGAQAEMGRGWGIAEGIHLCTPCPGQMHRKPDTLRNLYREQHMLQFSFL